MLDLVRNKKVLINAHQLYYTSERLNPRHNPTSPSSLTSIQTDQLLQPKSSIFSLPASLPVIDHGDHHSHEPEICTLKPSDLTLLSRWCASTYRSLTPDGKNGQIWRSTIVREAMSNPPLLNSILAVAALDIAYTCGGDSAQRDQHDHQQIQCLAVLHWDQARAGLERQLNRDRSERCRKESNFMMAMCNILIILAFGHIRMPPFSSGSALVDLCHIFRQLRGSPEVLLRLIDEVKPSEELAFLVRQETGPTMPNTSTLAIHALRKLHNDDSKGWNYAQTREIYNKAIDSLASCLRYIAWGSHPGLVGISWPLEVPAVFVDLVLDHQPMALTIMAHYCVVLYHLRSHWWMGAFGIKVLEEIRQLLGSDRLENIQWAIDGISTDGTTHFD
ncbi:hypothetical protein ASPFODRAFT_35097 [Aspergillus luchuensis CBS 106.47]|uniref:Zn(II)2Cys6 transcription factor n=3 Tax=Aspergillus kawachii TaxID=1069201 RepID=A0A1M3TA39_ASPLC|nr:hypothetical protein ASPFODRAFT_35097 [Aspergillus luchuensis CBS 106.47]BCS10622.1 hypothetical protein ALUC_31439S [Aspergillus luchuensis]